jgi:hypothetical protein
MSRIKKILGATLIAFMVMSAISFVFAGFIGDVPIFPIRVDNKSDQLGEDDPLYMTTMKAGILIGQIESGVWIWRESYGEFIIKPGGLIGTHPIIAHPLYDDTLPVLFSFHAELRDPEDNFKGIAYSFEDGVDPDTNPPRPIELYPADTKPILVYGFASPATLVGDGSVSNVPEEETLQADVDVNPDTLNLKSNGEWITVYIELPEGYDVNMVSDVLLSVPTGVDSYMFVHCCEAPSSVGDYDGDGVADIMVKFDRSEVIELLGAEDVVDESFGNDDDVTLMVSGTVLDSFFAGADTIKVKSPGR